MAVGHQYREAVRYGFAIDQRTCIGCHACTVACKTEHQVPLGQFRTWVKYVDAGEFPHTTRSMAVLRCNHCTDAPCTRICPTSALFTRDDGIVDFDNSRCIGCKACLQACPYDALYIDAESHTAAKCNFCAHRVDAGLEPACVVVCPTESIWVGDLADPSSAIATFVAEHDTLVRTPEQGTGPNVHYVGAHPAALDPLAAPVDDSYLWAQPDALRLAVAADLGADSHPAEPRTTLNTAHPAPWGWKVTTYLWAKGVAAGAMIMPAIAWATGTHLGPLGAVAAPLIAMAGLLATAILLVADLKRPERFWYLLTKANTTSWLAKGGLVLGAAALVCFVWFWYGILADTGPPSWLLVVGAVAGVFTAGYTAFLFGQAEGRDLWQSRGLFGHLVVQAVMVGSGALLVAGLPLGVSYEAVWLLVAGLVVGAIGHLGLAAVELTGRGHTPNATAAILLMTKGRHRATLRAGMGLTVLGAVLAAGVLMVTQTPLGGLLALAAGVLVQAALLAYEHVFVRAAQEVPLS